MALKARNSEEELYAVFERWDLDHNGTLDFKELDRAIRGAKQTKEGAHAERRGTATAKDLQAALDERLAGKKRPAPLRPRHRSQNLFFLRWRDASRAAYRTCARVQW